MKRIKTDLAALMLVLVVVFAAGCKPKDNDDIIDNNDTDDIVVEVTTYMPQDITTTTAVTGGHVVVSSGVELDELGVCWSTDSVPEASYSHISTDHWNEPFVCTLKDLIPNTQYYVRAYAKQGLECYYGETKSFATEDDGGMYNHAYVDLDLPTGTLWATCNVGATTPEERGDCFAWAEAQPVLVYNWSTYKYCNGDFDQLTRYCTQANFGYNGYVDYILYLVHEDDAATVNWGSSWSTPTEDQWEELLQYTTNCWTTQNGVNGRLFTASNGNSIFLPAGGAHFTGYDYIGERGYYWSKKLTRAFPCQAICFTFKADEYKISSDYRFYNFSVRPVTSKY